MNPVDPYQVIFHPVQVDERVHYPSHFKRFEVQMFAFADDGDNLSHQVNFFFFLVSSSIKLSSHISAVFLQVFVHCDVMICDAKGPKDAVCNKLCSEDMGMKGRFSLTCKGIRFESLPLLSLQVKNVPFQMTTNSYM